MLTETGALEGAIFKEETAMDEDSTVFVGLDLGDRYSEMYIVDGAGQMIETGRVPTTTRAIERRFRNSPTCRIGLEAGTHSSWVSRLLESLGHEVVVADARRLRLIYQNERMRSTWRGCSGWIRSCCLQ